MKWKQKYKNKNKKAYSSIKPKETDTKSLDNLCFITGNCFNIMPQVCLATHCLKLHSKETKRGFNHQYTNVIHSKATFVK